MIRYKRKRGAITRFLLWLKKAVIGNEKKVLEHKNDNKDIEWLTQLKPALNELLETLEGVPDEVKAGVFNYVISKISEEMYPLSHKSLSRAIGGAIFSGLNQDQNVPQVHEDGLVKAH